MLPEDKRALSNLVAYVLLIVITISLSVMVYGWLKFYVESDDVESCPDNVNIIIENYSCVSGASGSLKVTLRNKGLFNIDGFILRVHNRTDAEFGFYVLEKYDEAELRTGDSLERTYPFNDPDFGTEGIDIVTLVEVQPFLDDGDRIVCESYVSQKVVCNP